MADVTGALYEAFVGYLLHRLGYRDEWTPGAAREYRFGSHSDAQCHRGKAGCANALACSEHAAHTKVPYGPWYDPDFFITDGATPAACIHITHWSNPGSSQYKFWRTIEDHLQYKIYYGHHFLSVNALFVALDRNEKPRRVVDTDERLELHGWKPANGAVLAVSFDSSLIFPVEYEPLAAVLSYLPERMPNSPRRKQETWRTAFDSLSSSNRKIRQQIADASKLLRSCLEGSPHRRYTSPAIMALQERCWAGRQRAVELVDTSSRYRKGVQHAFLLSEVVSLSTGRAVSADTVVASIANNVPRFLAKDLPKVMGLESRPHGLEEILAEIPVRIAQGVYIPLMNRAAGTGHYDWDPDLKQFVLAVQALSESARVALIRSLSELFGQYRAAYGMSHVIADLADSSRIQKKVAYVRKNLLGLRRQADFVRAFVDCVVSHSTVVVDVHNWPIELVLEAYSLGSMQHVTTTLPTAFKAKTGDSLRLYSYMGNVGQLVSHLISGAKIGQYFSSRATLSEEKFLKTIWILFAECIWSEIAGRESCDDDSLQKRYRYKKSMRIISSSDLEPVSFLFRREFPMLAKGPTLRGGFNQLSTAKGWGRTALATETTGRDLNSGAVFHTQSVFGGKHIADKTKELAGRMRANHLAFGPDGAFIPEPSPATHYLVVDGDWPINAKINLLESGFAGVFELGDLASLRHQLAVRVRAKKDTKQ